MASNSMFVCLDCRVGGKGILPKCSRDSHRTLCFGSKITVPKKNNTRAWKRIEKGEYLWDRRKTRYRSPFKGRRLRDTVTKYDTEIVHPDGMPHLKRRVKIAGTERQVANYSQLPNVDLGG